MFFLLENTITISKLVNAGQHFMKMQFYNLFNNTFSIVGSNITTTTSTTTTATTSTTSSTSTTSTTSTTTSTTSTTTTPPPAVAVSSLAVYCG
ncbi:unnamed protein product [Rotaria magnacalcarata]|uniref:Uncharacterized protein n=1 Tax=Rotaria magnacalcarata TaxID=392030 RepID=A0A816Y3S1_9BILA|nr:unnamed protein product [Rotaria magnacalcarata]